MRRRWLPLAVVPAAALAAGVVVPVTTATADTHQRIVSAQHRLAVLNHEAERYAERLDAARQAFTTARARQQQADRAQARAQAQLAASRAALGRFAVQAYRTGSVDSAGLSALTSGSPQQFLDRLTMLDAVSKSVGETVDAFEVARHRAAVASAAATAARRDAAAKLASVRQARAAILDKARELNALLRQLHRKAAAEAAARAARALARQSSYSVPHVRAGVAAHAAEVAVQWAKRELGKPYVWGAAGPDSFDCSGLTMYVYAQAGIALPHYTGAQWNSGRHVPLSSVRPGDLIFYFHDLSHVAIYIGGGEVIHAPHTGDVVRIAPMNMDPIAGAVRIAG